MNNTAVRTNHLLPYPIIVLASTGDVDAINIVLKHYSRYITALSLKPIRDDRGNECISIDEGLRHRIETKLITKILTFRA